VNGDLVDHQTIGSDAAPSIIAAVPMLGRSGTYTSKTLAQRYFHGYLKDARVYPSALPGASIKSIYATEW